MLSVEEQLVFTDGTFFELNSFIRKLSSKCSNQLDKIVLTAREFFAWFPALKNPRYEYLNNNQQCKIMLFPYAGFE